jgi:hypothetical protein
MRARIAATASVLALLAGPALMSNASAQTTAPSPQPGGSMSAPSAAMPRTPRPDPMTLEDVSAIKGSAVYGSDDKKIGSISTVLMKADTKTVDRVVVSEGGLLGVGSHLVALPIGDFKWDGLKDAFKISKTADQLKEMPEWKAASAEPSRVPAAASGSSLPAAPRTPVAPPAGQSGSSGSTSTTE